jgi:hypothetical protein
MVAVGCFVLCRARRYSDQVFRISSSAEKPAIKQSF